MRKSRFGRRMSFGKRVKFARPIVRAAMGTVLPKRILLDEFSIPDATSASFDNPVEFDLVRCTEAMAEPVESTGGTTAGTDVAQVPLYSRFLSLKANFILRSTGTKLIRWMLIKNENDNLSAATIMAGFHTSNEGVSDKAIRRMTLAKGLVSISSDKLQAPLRIFIRRSAIARLQAFKEDDTLTMVFAANTEGTNTVTLSGYGTAYFKANA